MIIVGLLYLTGFDQICQLLRFINTLWRPCMLVIWKPCKWYCCVANPLGWVWGVTESVCKTMLEKPLLGFGKPLLGFGNGTYWSQISLS